MKCATCGKSYGINVSSVCPHKPFDNSDDNDYKDDAIAKTFSSDGRKRRDNGRDYDR